MYLKVHLLFFLLHIVLFVSFSNKLVYDYKKLCEEILRNCKYESINVATKGISAYLASKENDLNDWIVEFNTQLDFVELDNLLTPRPWWAVLDQPNAVMTASSTHRSLVLHRIPSKAMEASRYIANINFPIEKGNLACETRPAFICAQTGTWGNGLLNMQVNYGHFRKAVFIPLTTRTGSKHDRVFLADEHACPDIVNKWECLFLPPTTCPWSTAVTSLDGRGYLSSPSAGIKITKEDITKRLELLPDLGINEFVTAGNVFASSDPYMISPNMSRVSSRGGGSVLDSHFLYGVVTRFNARFRAIVQQVIDDFRSTCSPVFRPNMTCVAVHVRRDDRALPGEDMFEWCKTHTTINSKGESRPSGLWTDGSRLSSGQWMDMGCNKKVPFGAVSLDHYLNASRVLLPENRNVFMMTDDPKWLRGEIQKYYASRKQLDADTMNIFTPNIRPNHRGGTFNSSVDFWASITMARQCQAVVGHLGSAAFVVIYNNLCYYHDNQFFTCPPLYNTAGT